jgi:hypothetical protein
MIIHSGVVVIFSLWLETWSISLFSSLVHIIYCFIVYDPQCVKLLVSCLLCLWEHIRHKTYIVASCSICKMCYCCYGARFEWIFAYFLFNSDMFGCWNCCLSIFNCSLRIIQKIRYVMYDNCWFIFLGGYEILIAFGLVLF